MTQKKILDFSRATLSCSSSSLPKSWCRRKENRRGWTAALEVPAEENTPHSPQIFHIQICASSWCEQQSPHSFARHLPMAWRRTLDTPIHRHKIHFTDTTQGVSQHSFVNYHFIHSHNNGQPLCAQHTTWRVSPLWVSFTCSSRPSQVRFFAAHAGQVKVWRLGTTLQHTHKQGCR